MKTTQDDRTPQRSLDRRSFLGAAGIAGMTSLIGASPQAYAETEDAGGPNRQLQTGNGEWTYQVVPGWGRLPEGESFGGTHGAIATDKAGLLYVSTQSDTGILVYDHSGNVVKTIAKEYPEVHSLTYANEDGREYFYATVQKGTPKENWIFVKMTTDGKVAQRITAPPEAGFKTPNEWRITAAVVGPDGSIYIANGYGDSRVFVFDKNANYKKSFGRKGKADGEFDCSHGLSVDMRYDQPMLLVADRENRRLCHYDFDGKFVSNITYHLRRPCQITFFEDYAVVSELEGRVTVLDKDNVPVAFLGDNPDKGQWANYGLKPAEIAATSFSAAHGCFIDRDSSIYVSDWNRSGRLTKLVRVRA
jgi:hypothetical protein